MRPQRAGVAATPKALVANDAETDGFTVEARVDGRTLRGLYLAPFELIVREARPWTVLVATTPSTPAIMADSLMLDDVLKEEWGFDGFVILD